MLYDSQYKEHLFSKDNFYHITTSLNNRHVMFLTKRK